MFLHDFAFGANACCSLCMLLILNVALFNYHPIQMRTKYSVFRIKSCKNLQELFSLYLKARTILWHVKKARVELKALFTISVKNFVCRAFFFVSLMYDRNFLLYAENFLRSKVCLKKHKCAERTKFFTLFTTRFRALFTRSAKNSRAKHFLFNVR